MPEKTKQDEDDEKEVQPENCDKKDDDNWSKDQREKSYYYDDSYGYEVYNPDEDEDDDE
jgi:hypothetical protein